MYYKVVNGFDADMLLKAAEEEFVFELKNESVEYKESVKLAVQSLREQVVRLDSFYDENRSADADLGGYAYFFPTCEDVKRKEVEKINDTFKGVAAELRAQGM